jgi:hypothetical protein
MQQMLRYVAEGGPKDAAMLLGLQGTIYGMAGLPGYNFINQHIVGTLSSNKAHTDLYDATYGIAGKQIGDFLTYGLPSNLLQANIYSRGDMNPRQFTVLPVDPSAIPIVHATVGALSNLKTTLGRLNDGGNAWETILQGFEHNGICRPLAGLAQVAQLGVLGKETATSQSGTILGQNDLFHIATMARLAGGRPLDEALANDAVYRTNAYKAVDAARVKNLDGAIRTAVIGGQIPSNDQYARFAGEYAAIGGTQKNFNQHMLRVITSANTPQANAIAKQLQTPMGQNMQEIIGGSYPTSESDQ